MPFNSIWFNASKFLNFDSNLIAWIGKLNTYSFRYRFYQKVFHCILECNLNSLNCFNHKLHHYFFCFFPYIFSMLIGNTFVFFQFQGKDHIDSSTRNIVFSVLISVAIVGVIFFAILRRVNQPFEENTRDRELQDRSNSNSIIGAFLQAIRLFFTRNMLLLCITFLYTGKWTRIISVLFSQMDHITGCHRMFQSKFELSSIDMTSMKFFKFYQHFFWFFFQALSYHFIAV